MYKILKKKQLSEVVWLMEVEAPLVARSCQPGQFVIVKHGEVGERIPLTICDYDRERGTITIVFQPLGVSTLKSESYNHSPFLNFSYSSSVHIHNV